MKKWMKWFAILSGVVLLLSFGCNRARAVIWSGTLTIRNEGTNVWHYGTCGGVTITAEQFDCGGNHTATQGSTNSPISVPDIPAGGVWSLDITTLFLSSNDYNCGIPDYSKNIIRLYYPGGNLVTSQEQDGQANTDQNFSPAMTVHGCQLIPQDALCTNTTTVINRDVVAHHYQYGMYPANYVNGVPTTFIIPGDTCTLVPGASQDLSVVYLCINEGPCGVIDSPFSTQTGLQETNGSWNGLTNLDGNGQGLGQVPGNQTQPNGAPVVSSLSSSNNGVPLYNAPMPSYPGGSNVTQGGIVWSPSTATNTALAVQQAAGSLFAQNGAENAMVNSALNGIGSDLSNIVGAVYSTGTSLSNVIGRLGSTNGTGGNGGSNSQNSVMTNYALETTQSGISNMFAQGSFSNVLVQGGLGFGVGSNIMGIARAVMMGLLPAEATNPGAAFAKGLAAETNYDPNGVLTEALNAPDVQSDNQAEPLMMIYDFCGQDIDMNPVHMFPVVATASHLGFTIAAELGFLLWFGKIFWELVRAKGATKTGGVPDLEIFGEGEIFGWGGGVGGNFVGVIVSLLMPLAVIGAFYAVLAWLFSQLGFAIADAFNFSSFENSLGGIAVYLLCSYIPVNLIFTLTCSAVTIQLTVAKFYNIACNICRYLWGG